MTSDIILVTFFAWAAVVSVIAGLAALGHIGLRERFKESLKQVLLGGHSDAWIRSTSRVFLTLFDQLYGGTSAISTENKSSIESGLWFGLLTAFFIVLALRVQVAVLRISTLDIPFLPENSTILLTAIGMAVVGSIQWTIIWALPDNEWWEQRYQNPLLAGINLVRSIYVVFVILSPSLMIAGFAVLLAFPVIGLDGTLALLAFIGSIIGGYAWMGGMFLLIWLQKINLGDIADDPPRLSIHPLKASLSSILVVILVGLINLAGCGRIGSDGAIG